jgi:hypothetical protein
MTIIAKEERDEIVISVGLKTAQSKDWYIKWRGVVRNAKHRELECTLTFLQYMKLVVRAGLKKPSEIGIDNHQYNLARKGDTGGYTWGNCRFVTARQNRRERAENGVFDDYAATLRGQTKDTHPTYAAISRARKGITKETHPSVALAANAIAKNFRVKSPTGRIYKGRNLSEFCKEHGLAMSSMAAVCREPGRSIHGWTGRYVNSK